MTVGQTFLRKPSSSMLVNLCPLVRIPSRLPGLFAKEYADEMVLQLNKLEKLRVCEGLPLSSSRMSRRKGRKGKRANLESLFRRLEVQKRP